MVVYITFLLFSTLMVFINKITRRYYSLNSLIYWIGGIYLIFIAGSRDVSVGIDTSSYYSYFNRDIPIDEIAEYYHYTGQLFWYMMYYVKGYLGDYRVVVYLTSLLSIGLLFYVVKHKSYSPYLSMVIYMALGFYAIGLNIIREYLGIAVYMLAVYNLANGKKKKFLLITTIAFFIHPSLILGYLLYFVYDKKINIKIVTLYLLSGITLFIFFKIILSVVIMALYGGDEAILSLLGEDGGGKLTFILYILLLFVATVLKNDIISVDKNNLIYIHMMYIATIIQSATFLFPIASRAAYIYSIALIILIPNIIHSIRNVYARVYSTVLLVLVCWGMYFLKFYNLQGAYPYKFFFL